VCKVSEVSELGGRFWGFEWVVLLIFGDEDREGLEVRDMTGLV